MSLATVQLMSIMNEKVVHGKALMPYIPPALEKQIAQGLVHAKQVGSEEEALAMLRNPDDKTSILQNDAYTSVIHKELERYDQALDELVLKSDNIVKSYNMLLEAQFEKAVEFYKEKFVGKEYADKESAPCFDALDATAAAYLAYKDLPGVDEVELKKAIVHGSFLTSDNPDKIKAQLQIRINYNKAMISMFQEMLKTNYELLGFSKDEALILSQKLVSGDVEERKSSIKELKAAVLANKGKFEIGKGRLDFRSIGGGVYFGTPKQTGLDKFMSVDRMLQYTLEYDCIIFGHGGSETENYTKAQLEEIISTEKFDKFYKENSEKLLEYDKKIADCYDNVSYMMRRYPELKESIRFSPTERLRDYQNMVKKYSDKGEKIKNFIETFKKKIKNPELTKDEIQKCQKVIDSLQEQYYKTGKILLEFEKIEFALAKELEEQFGKYNSPRIMHQEEQIKKYANAMQEKIRKNNKDLEEAKATYQQLNKAVDDAKSRLNNIIYNEYDENGPKKGVKTVWSIQPVWTENAGPFNEMNELVRQCIKEGHKSILVVSCNPVHHVLDKDLRDRKDVLIRHVENTLLAESVVAPMDDPDWDAFDPLDEASQILFETEQHLIQACNESGFDYYDDEYLNECALFVEQNVETLNEEGIGRKIWTKIKELAKKVFGLFAKLIKGVINFFRNLIDKIKNFFKKLFGSGKVEKPLRKSFKTSFIMVESASVRNLTVNNWDVLQKGCLDSCEKIANKIKKVEREQTALFKQAEQFAEQQERKAPQNENAYTSYTIEMLKRLADI